MSGHSIPTRLHVQQAKAHINLWNRAVWSEFSQGTLWIAEEPKLFQADRQYSGQHAHPRRLIRVFAAVLIEFCVPAQIVLWLKQWPSSKSRVIGWRVMWACSAFAAAGLVLGFCRLQNTGSCFREGVSRFADRELFLSCLLIKEKEKIFFCQEEELNNHYQIILFVCLEDR